MRSDDEIYDAFKPLWADISGSESYPDNRPLLAHHTSIENLENIMTNDELWFSNPLCICMENSALIRVFLMFERHKSLAKQIQVERDLSQLQ